MSKVKVLTKKEIENIKEVREAFQILVGKVGDVEITMMNLNRTKKNLEEELLEIQNKESKIALDLEKKYGKGNISLETGEFTPVE
tara:strand:+ start:228 stop:482 length:255 start_codon:yes stop_codon:yes gene_type:complete